jgi:cerevisin
MRFIAVALALACAAFAVPIGLNPVHRFNGRAVPGSYIVTLKPGVSREAHLASLASLADMKVISDSWEEDFFHGYSGEPCATEWVVRLA